MILMHGSRDLISANTLLAITKVSTRSLALCCWRLLAANEACGNAPCPKKVNYPAKALKAVTFCGVHLAA